MKVTFQEQNPRVETAMELAQEISCADDPQKVLLAIARNRAKLFGPRGYVSISVRGLPPGDYKITRILHDNEVTAASPTNPWETWDELPTYRGGLIGKILAQGKPAVLTDMRNCDDSVLCEILPKYHAAYVLPLYDAGKILNWAIYLLPDEQAVAQESLEEALLRTNLVGSNVKEKVMSRELRKANERIRLEMNRIAQIQRSLLPGSLPAIPGTDIAVSYETFDEAGGDLYDLYPLSQAHGGSPDDPRWAVLIGDVSGHGPSAAVMMAMLHTILRTYPGVPDDPACLLHYANHHFFQRQIDQSFVTAFLAIYDPTTRELIYARAGHNPPLVKGPGTHSELRILDENGGIPLGVLEDTTYDHATTRLEPSETLVLYTDGITEARGPGRRMFGIEGIEASLVDCSGEPSCVIEKVNFDLKLFQWGVRPQDDQTLLALQAVEG